MKQGHYLILMLSSGLMVLGSICYLDLYHCVEILHTGTIVELRLVFGLDFEFSLVLQFVRL